MTDEKPKPRERPPKPIPKPGAAPAHAARAIFSAGKPPDPERRIAKPERALAR